MKVDPKAPKHSRRKSMTQLLLKKAPVSLRQKLWDFNVKRLLYPILFVLLLSHVCALSNAQLKFAWAKGMGGSNDDAGQSTVVDAAGNLYTVGYFSGTADFDPGPEMFILTSQGNTGVFISKLNADGNLVWAKQIGANNSSLSGHQNFSIALDTFGNVYTTGTLNLPGDFDPGLGTYYLQGPGLYENVFISKLDSSGNFVWAKAVGGQGSVYSKSITVTAAGDVFITGFFQCNLFMDFDPGPSTFTLVSYSTYYDAFVEKLDSSGNFVWAKKVDRSGMYTTDIYSYSAAADSYGNVYVVGHYWSSLSPNPTRAKFYTFIDKWSPAGDLIWRKGSFLEPTMRQVCWATALLSILQEIYTSLALAPEPSSLEQQRVIFTPVLQDTVFSLSNTIHPAVLYGYEAQAVEVAATTPEAISLPWTSTEIPM